MAYDEEVSLRGELGEQISDVYMLVEGVDGVLADSLST